MNSLKESTSVHMNVEIEAVIIPTLNYMRSDAYASTVTTSIRQYS